MSVPTCLKGGVSCDLDDYLGPDVGDDDRTAAEVAAADLVGPRMDSSSTAMRTAARSAAWRALIGVLRPTMTRMPSARNRPATIASGRAVGPMTAPTTASWLVLILVFTHKRFPGS